jgi:hypothetical protein
MQRIQKNSNKKNEDQIRYKVLWNKMQRDEIETKK